MPIAALHRLRRHRGHRAGLLLALLTVVVASVSCAPGVSQRDPEREITSATPIGDVFAPRFEFDASESAIERFDPPGAGAGLVLALASQVRNPNSFPVVLQRVEWRLRVAGEVAAAGVRELDLVLEAGSSVPLWWRLDADLADRTGLWSPVVAAYAGTPLPVELEGRVVFASQSYSFTTGQRTLLAGAVLARQNVVPPRLRLEGVNTRLTLVRSDAPVVTVGLVAQNPGDVGYFLSGRALALELNGAVVALLDLTPGPLPAGETVRRELVFLIDAARLDETARSALAEALAGRSAEVRVLGTFAYDVLGVDSFAVELAEPLSVRIPRQGLPAGD